MILSGLVDPEVQSQLARVPSSVNELGFDAWGFSPERARLLYSLARKIHDYFRPEVEGAEHIPAGRVLIVPNHAGQLPFDGIVVAVACLLQANPPRTVRAMIERWLPQLPFVDDVLLRGGAVLGAPINCRNLLEDEQAILVFPEGARGSGKVWRDRYRLEKFGRGFMRLALQTNTPIVPCAVVGSEESIISVHSSKILSKLLRAPYFPIHPLLPLLGPLAYLPLPVKFHLRFGPQLRFEGEHDADDAVIEEKVAVVQGAVQHMVDDLRARRKGWF